MYGYVCIYMCIIAYIYLSTCTYAYICVYIPIYAYVCINMPTYAYINVYLYVHNIFHFVKRCKIYSYQFRYNLFLSKRSIKQVVQSIGITY